MLPVLACITVGTPTPPADLMSTVDSLQTDIAAASVTIGAALTAKTPTPPNTPMPLPAMPTPSPTLPSPTPTGLVVKVDIADFVSETVPDGTVLAPGSAFRKSWRLINRGRTSWDKNYALVFMDGFRLGAPEVIQLPQDVPPGNIINLSINLKAPDIIGEYTGYWMLRNNEGIDFGLGPNDVPFSVNILVGDPWIASNGPVKSVTIDQLTRVENHYDCLPGVKMTFMGTIIVNSPGEVVYTWQHDGVNSGLTETHRFKTAGEKLEVYHEWIIHSDTQGDVTLIVLKPYELVSNIGSFEIICK